jgi:hypothetical protein
MQIQFESKSVLKLWLANCYFLPFECSCYQMARLRFSRTVHPHDGNTLLPPYLSAARSCL